MMQILLSWIGTTDLRAPTETDSAGLGPIAQAVLARKYTEVVLVSDYSEQRISPYLDWLNTKTDAKISVQYEPLTSPTDFGEIYQAASRAVSNTIKENGSSVNFTFHLSPGTPAMAAVWIVLAKTRFPAELIESSREHGVRTASVPFEISAEYIPDLLRRPDAELEKLAIGLPAEAPEFDDIIHRSEIMQRVILKARRVAPHSIPVLIEGESGTGKEMLARAIHEASPRRKGPFLAFNCGAIPPELVESELFGHEKGAFTGAAAARKGYFEGADGGTLFLDEIGELPKSAQVKMLRVLQEKEIVRVGATRPIRIDTRTITATNRNLIEEVSKDNFREDLFYRLAVAVIKMPPLREREGDIGLLIDNLLEKINEESASEFGQKQKIISVPAKNIMLNHHWPGNVRELINTLLRAVIWSSGDAIDEEDIREALLPAPNQMQSGTEILERPLKKGFNLPEIMKEVAVHYLQRGLEATHGNKTKTAELLGLPSYQTLTNWLKKYGLE